MGEHTHCVLMRELTKQFEERGVYAGWSREHAVKVLSDHLTGKQRLASGDLYGLRVMMQLKGWGEVGVGVVLNQQINFTQANGKV